MKEVIYKKIINNFELYLATILFIALTVVLTVQVVSRYCLKSSLTWTEEIANILFLWMIYLGVAAAVTKRKHLRIDCILNIVPFKVKKTMLIISNIIFSVFNIYITFIFMDIFDLMGNSSTTMLHISQQFVYSIIPITLILSVVRLVQDTIRLYREDEKTLGISVPAMNLDECEAIYKAKLAEHQQERGCR